ncbi:permease-like cell division protein FtsX [Uliginosibacterium sp. H3]|uniref:Cell division protein FtsX n=1 Tax=Uliginosibacterium silvisoli TaxID=3114758 RepID=A0ABU6K1M4_9RHOO|nr:permease-like cell division protein FtsX [Uliginosibacterium sp. H3]
MSAHFPAIRQALQRLVSKPLTTLLSALVIAIALALPALGYVLVDNVASLARGISGKPEISVFLKVDVPTERVKAIETRLRANPQIAALRFVPRDEALKQLAARGGFGDVTGALADNPLPDAFILDPRDDSPASFEALRNQISTIPEVAQTQLDSEWVERLHAIVALARSTTLLLASLLGTALIIVTFNTIRLQILTQRHEISVKLLLGATRNHVRRPFLYFGLLQGLLGGLLAWALVAGLLRVMAPQIEALAQRYSIVLAIGGPALWQAAVLCAFAALLGWLGAAISVRRHLHDGLVD